MLWVRRGNPELVNKEKPACQWDKAFSKRVSPEFPSSVPLNSGARKSDGNKLRSCPLLTAAKPAPVPLRVLLVGNQEEDFFLIREILERSRSRLAAELEHARSIDEARTMLQRQSYGLVLFEHETGDEAADDEDDELELQAETASASARPSTGARMIRRATSGNRMRVLSLGRMYF